MLARITAVLLVLFFLTSPAWAQTAPTLRKAAEGPTGSNPPATEPAAGKWRTPGTTAAKPKEPATGTPLVASTPAVAGTPAPAGGTEPARPAAARVITGPGVLPSDHGQVWREYDISPYTSKITTTERPEQAITDWILRETGTEVWFSEPLGLMSADRRSLRVYHTPEMHKLVASVVDRFVASEGESQVLSVRLLSVGNPNWRGKVHSLLRPIAVQTAGVEAWLTSRENAATVLGELKKRPDFREQNTPHVVIHNGQSQTIARSKPRSYTRASLTRDPSRLGGDVELGQIDEGFSLQISPLMSVDGQTADAVIKCQIDQVEKLTTIFLEPANPLVSTQRTQVQVPQLVSWRLHERFRWPADQVILLSCGVVAAPPAEKASPLAALTGSSPGRADALLIIECLGQAHAGLVEPARSANASPATRGRY